MVNGFFIILVFFTHFSQYTTITNTPDIILYKFIDAMEQLIVTTFLFFSGYGIHESIKNKGEPYIKQFFKHRFLPTYTNWFLAITAFLILNIILQNHLTIQKVILSYIGWKTLGNSNWYLFDIFILYFLIMFSFNLFKKENIRIASLTITTIIFIIFLSFFKQPYWYNTLLCFPLGMIYSYYKDKIDARVMKNNKNYLMYFVCTSALFIMLFFGYRLTHIQILFNFTSCLFVLVISLLLMKFELKSQILYWCGKNLFWLYILQRIPMIIFRDHFSDYNVYFITCFITTIVIVYFITYIKQKKLKRKNTPIN